MNETAKQALANTFVMYFKAHSYHWNVEGMFFPQLHEFFGDLYGDYYDAVDSIAEEIRALGEYAPRSLDELFKSKTVDADNVAKEPKEMIADLLIGNNQTTETLNKLFDELTAAKKQGFANFVADRIDKQEKHAWMLKSLLKNIGE